MRNRTPSAVVGLSGGVDSAAALYLLRRNGCRVVGVTLRMLCIAEGSSSGRECCSAESMRRAARLCKRLDVDYYCIDVKDRFRKFVIDNAIDAEAAKTVEPLMGWTSASDMRNNEVRMRFDSKEAAVAFAEKHGLAYQLITPPPQRRKLKTYSDNFSVDRTMPWTH